jgi:hypothetical protein
MLLPGSHAHKEVLEEAGASDIHDIGLPAVEDEG